MLRELLAIFGIEVDDHELKDADKHVEGFAKKLEELEPALKKAARVLAEAFGAEKLKEFVKETLEVNSHLKDLSNRLDVGAQTIRNFGFLAKDAGVDLDSAANALGLLEKNLGEAASKGGQTAATFARLHVAVKGANGEARPLSDVLGDVAEGLSQLPDQNQRAAAAMELFGRSGRMLLPVLQDGKEALEDAMREAERLGNGLGEGFYDQVKRAADGFEHAEFAVQSLKDRALAAILPAVTLLGRILENITASLIELDKRTHIVQAAFVTLAIVIGVALVDALVSATAALLAFVGPWLLAFGPIIALVGGLVWLVQDLWNAMTGAKSVLGDLVEELGGVGARARFVEGLRALWDATKHAINDAAFALGYFFGVLAGVGDAVLGIETGDDAFLELAEDIGEAARALEWLIKLLETAAKFVGLGVIEQLRPYIGALRAAKELGGVVNEAVANTFGGQPGPSAADHGVPDQVVQEFAFPGVRQPKAFERGPSRAPGGRTMTFERGVRGLVSMPVTPVPRGAAGPGDRTIHQEIKNSVVVHTASDEPRAVGDAVGAGVATATQKDLNAALLAVVKP